MMRKILIVLLLALPVLTFAQKQKVAVYVTGENESMNKVLGSKLVTAIARSEHYIAIERTAAFLAKLSKEQNYQRTGAVDDDELSRLGKQFGVQLICIASLTEAFGGQYVSARLIDVETAQVERSAGSAGSLHSLNDLMDVASEISNELLNDYGTGSQHNLKKVAVYVTKNESGKGIGMVLGDKLVAGFTNSGRYIAVERTSSFLSQLNKEQTYQRTGAVDDNDISRLGKQFGVRYVCVADVSDVFGEKYISARLIDVETAEVVNTHDVGGQVNNMNDCVRMANEIASNLSKGTFAEQAEEARIKAAEEARKRAAEEARKKAEQEARERKEKAREKAKQDRINKRKQELLSVAENNYIIVKTISGEKWMVYLKPVEVTGSQIAENTKISGLGYDDWEIMPDGLFYAIITAPSEQSMINYINGYSDEITYNFSYILMEYIHYFDASSLSLPSGLYWDGPRHQNTLIWESESVLTMFLDGNTYSRQRLRFKSDPSYSSYKFKEKEWKKRVAWAFVARRM